MNFIFALQYDVLNGFDKYLKSSWAFCVALIMEKQEAGIGNKGKIPQ